MVHDLLVDSVMMSKIRKIKVSSLVPEQQPTRSQLLTSADCYQQRFIKFFDVATCHSYAEFIFALLLEGDPDVKSFIPQPFRLKVYNKTYIPDFYIVKNNHEYVIELKAPSGMDESLKLMVETFFSYKGMEFQLIPNTEVLDRELEALNWLQIIQVLVFARKHEIDTTNIEYDVLQQCCEFGTKFLISDLYREWGEIDRFDYREIALYRLIHQHYLSVDLTVAPLSFDTEVTVCT